MSRNEKLIPRSELSLYGATELDTVTLVSLTRAVKSKSLRLPDFNPLFVVGPHASGKSALAKHALDDNSHQFFDTGPLLRSYHKHDCPNAPFGAWMTSSEEEYGATFADDVLAGHISTSLRRDAGKAVIIGNRSIDGIDSLSEDLGASDRKIVYIDAPTDLLHERYQKREQCRISIVEFEEILERDRRMGLSALMGAADIVIDNSSDFETAASQFQQNLTS
jgi:adenylate kinase family enzyme